MPTLQEALEARDQARLRAWTDSFASMAATLGGQWEHHGERIAQRQQEICSTLQETAAAMSEQSQAQARDTIAEIERLVQVASEAPKAAADVVAELRQKLSDSMVRDTAMLDERNRLLATLQTLLEAVNHASTEQRSAVDALVATSADLLERVGSRFTDRIEAETGKLGDAAAQVVAGATEVASLGDAFAGAVQAFGESNTALLERLQGIEQALDKSLARSDEQLAYYVAQAREVIDLSMLSQQQITEELRQLARAPGARPGRRGMSDELELEADSGAPVWAVFGDLMSVLLGAFVLILIGVIGVQLQLANKLDAEMRQHQREAQQRKTLEQALAVPLAAGRVTLVDGRIGIRGNVLFALNSDQLQPEGRDPAEEPGRAAGRLPQGPRRDPDGQRLHRRPPGAPRATASSPTTGNCRPSVR